MLLLAAALARGEVSTRAALEAAVRAARPGTRVEIAPGTYRGGLHFAGVRGTRDRPVVITAADPERPPAFEGGTNAFHFAGASWLVLEDLVLRGATGNGINIDDGGSNDNPARGLVLRRLVIRDVGPSGNRDDIKLSGVREFTVEECTVERWGDRGSGIDMVGCHDGRISGCVFRHADTKGSNGVQAKGGTTDVLVERCRFEHAGRRAVQLGGSTGREFFRPPLRARGNVEARGIRVAGCTIVGSEAAVAFVSSEDCVVRHNTIERPRRWVLRILMEATGDDFVPCRRGRFEHNAVLWRRGDLRAFVNVGPRTEPRSFLFEGNRWFCEDDPGASRPSLPAPERDGVYGRAPGRDVGAGAYDG